MNKALGDSWSNQMWNSPFDLQMQTKQWRMLHFINDTMYVTRGSRYKHNNINKKNNNDQ